MAVIAIAVVVVAGLIALVASGGGDDNDATSDFGVTPTYRVVTTIAPATQPSPPLPSSPNSSGFTETTSSPPSSPATSAPATVPPAPTGGRGPGDLGLATPISKPSCNGSWVVFIGAAVEPAEYAARVDAFLAQHPGSQYLRTDVTCSSLRARTDAGNAIYAVYRGPYTSFSQACAAAKQIGNGAYVKVLDNVTDPLQLPECP